MFSTVSLIDFGYDKKLSIMRTVNSVSNIWMTIGALEKKTKELPQSKHEVEFLLLNKGAKVDDWQNK